jgi:acetolactate synthase small subunit
MNVEPSPALRVALSVTLHHRSGALDRVIGLLRRHGCTLVSLTFGPAATETLDVADVTYVGPSGTRVARQLSRLVDVVGVDDLSAPSQVADDGPSTPFTFQADGQSPHIPET